MDIKKEIKKLIIEKGITMTDLVSKLNERYNRNDSLQNLSGKLNRGTLKFNEAQEILEVLEYQFSIEPKN